MKHNTQIIRAFSLIAAIFIIGFIIRPYLVPASFGKYGPYRGAHLNEERSAKPIYYDDSSCLGCHQDRLEKGEGGHSKVPCVDCHFLSVPHAEGETMELLSVIKKSARNTSELVFQTLLSVMSQGWNKEKISELVEKLNQTDPGMKIRIFRGDPVIQEYGDIPGQRVTREQDPDIMKALREGKEILSGSVENRVRFLYPVKAGKDCLNCHKEAKIGDINGVIDVTFPVDNNLKDKGEKNISQIIREDTRQAADLAYESLLMVMGRGWDSGRIRKMIEKLNSNGLNMNIKLYRSKNAAKKLGEIEGEREARENDPHILKALREGKFMEMLEKQDRLRFLYPIKNSEDCVNCHAGLKTEGAMALLDITFPAKRLKVHGLDKLADMPIDRSQRVCVICHEYLPSRPKGFPQQVVAKHLEEKGMEDKDTPCVDCHDPHVPGMGE